MKIKDLFPDNSPPLKIGNMFNSKEIDKAINTKNIVKRTVTLRNGVTGEVVCQRSIMTKE